MSDNFDALLGGRVTPSCSFNGQFPIRWGGTVLDVTRNQAYEYDSTTGKSDRTRPKLWPDGNPVMNVWVTLQTDVRDPSIQGDDGVRILVLDSKNKLEAVQQAVRDSGASFAKGGRLDIEYYGNDSNAKNPSNPPKLYRARYQGPTFDSALGQQAPPTQSAPASAWGQQQPAPAPAAPATGGWGSPAPAPAQGGWGAPPPPAPEPDPTTYEEFVAAFKRKGVDPSTITSSEQAAQVWALVKNNPNVA